MVHPAERPSARAVFTCVAPELFVADIGVACEFFTCKLGFVIVFLYGEPPFYGQVRRDGARLNLRCVDRPVIDPARRDREDLLSADIGVDTADEIARVFDEFSAAGVAFHQPLERMPWGAKTFIVKDGWQPASLRRPG